MCATFSMFVWYLCWRLLKFVSSFDFIIGEILVRVRVSTVITEDEVAEFCTICVMNYIHDVLHQVHSSRTSLLKLCPQWSKVLLSAEQWAHLISLGIARTTKRGCCADRNKQRHINTIISDTIIIIEVICILILGSSYPHTNSTNAVHRHRLLIEYLKYLQYPSAIWMTHPRSSFLPQYLMRGQSWTKWMNYSRVVVRTEKVVVCWSVCQR